MDSTPPLPPLHRRRTDETAASSPSIRKSRPTLPPPSTSSYDGIREETPPVSDYLQNLLNEKRAENKRIRDEEAARERDQATSASGSSKRAAPSSVANAFDPFRGIQSSPGDAIDRKREKWEQTARRASGMGQRQPHDMGMREMEEYISKMNNQNFDLKLELYHRRQRAEVLEAKFERMLTLEAEAKEFQIVNDELLLQLEKRDKAVAEAVQIITGLEERIDKLETQQSKAALILGSQRHYNTTTSSTVIPPSSPPELRSAVSPVKSPHGYHDEGRDSLGLLPSQNSSSSEVLLKTPTRKPSFLQSESEDTSALREVYLHRQNRLAKQKSYASLKRPPSVLSFAQEEDEDFANIDRSEMKSPVLSLLSKSSFLSMYGLSKNQSPRSQQIEVQDQPIFQVETGPAEAEPPMRVERVRTARVQQWLDNGEGVLPSSRKRDTSSESRAMRMSSIGTVLEQTPPPQVSRQSPPKSSSPKKISPFKDQEDYGTANVFQDAVKWTRVRHKSSLLDGPIFSTRELPPTPDTLHTASSKLRGGPSTTNTSSERSGVGGLSSEPAQSRASLVPSTDPDLQRPTTSEYDFNGIQAHHQNEEEYFRSYHRAADLRPSTAASDGQYSTQAFTPGMSKAVRTLGMDSPSRRKDSHPLGVNNMMFNGMEDDIPLAAQVPSTRMQKARRKSMQLFSPNQRTPASSAEENGSDIVRQHPIEQGWPGQGGEDVKEADSKIPRHDPVTVTPMKTAVPQHSQQSSKLPRSASHYQGGQTASGIPGAAKTRPSSSGNLGPNIGPTHTIRPNFANRIFRRSNSQNQTTSPTEPGHPPEPDQGHPKSSTQEQGAQRSSAQNQSSIVRQTSVRHHHRGHGAPMSNTLPRQRPPSQSARTFLPGPGFGAPTGKDRPGTSGSVDYKSTGTTFGTLGRRQPREGGINGAGSERPKAPRTREQRDGVDIIGSVATAAMRGGGERDVMSGDKHYPVHDADGQKPHPPPGHRHPNVDRNDDADEIWVEDDAQYDHDQVLQPPPSLARTTSSTAAPSGAILERSSSVAESTGTVTGGRKWSLAGLGRTGSERIRRGFGREGKKETRFN
ncbi:hypothetical protein MMC25_005878 [Agyrium rufum]|nr:hypothetical protein [Agyrium rufum]